MSLSQAGIAVRALQRLYHYVPVFPTFHYKRALYY